MSSGAGHIPSIAHIVSEMVVRGGIRGLQRRPDDLIRLGYALFPHGREIFVDDRVHIENHDMTPGSRQDLHHTELIRSAEKAIVRTGDSIKLRPDEVFNVKHIEVDGGLVECFEARPQRFATTDVHDERQVDRHCQGSAKSICAAYIVAFYQAEDE